jgi:nanoRNase/pAp phosphatase (c-di-AMP/oligoRNAs hydrolase)
MAVIDVFNGDADGICALVQLRNAYPCDDNILVTGVKRDIALTDRVDAKEGDNVTILDISMDKNQQGLAAILAIDANCLYIDHHFAGDIPTHQNLHAIINTAADVCTSILVNNFINGQFVEWAIVGAYGDNLNKSAEILAKPLGLTIDQLEQLKNLGIYINYNGYGASLDDLHFTPEQLFRLVNSYSSPFDFIESDSVNFEKLEQGYQADMASAQNLTAVSDTKSSAVFILPNKTWARRVSGVYSNDLANASPNKAHAVLTEKSNGNYLVSIRAPLNNKTGADEICRQFPTGGGRKAAAGINDLPVGMYDQFVDTFSSFYQS